MLSFSEKVLSASYQSSKGMSLAKEFDIESESCRMKERLLRGSTSQHCPE